MKHTSSQRYPLITPSYFVWEPYHNNVTPDIRCVNKRGFNQQLGCAFELNVDLFYTFRFSESVIYSVKFVSCYRLIKRTSKRMSSLWSGFCSTTLQSAAKWPQCHKSACTIFLTTLNDVWPQFHRFIAHSNRYEFSKHHNRKKPFYVWFFGFWKLTKY